MDPEHQESPRVHIDSHPRVEKNQGEVTGVYIKEFKGTLTTSHPVEGTDLLPSVRAKIPIGNLARYNTCFVDRRQELKELVKYLAPGKRVTLCAPAGMGKTALAIHAIDILTCRLKRAPEKFPHGVIAYRFDGRESVYEALAHIAIQLGCNSREAKEAPTEMARLMLNNRTLLILLDGTENIETKSVEEILDVLGRCGVIITTRDPNIYWGHFIALNPLPENPATKLLASEYSEIFPSDLVKIVRQMGGFPLGLLTVGRLLRVTKIAPKEYIQKYRSSSKELLELGIHSGKTLRLLMEEHLKNIDHMTKEASSIIGHLAFAPFSTDTVAAGMAVNTNIAQDALGNLAKHGIVSRQNGYWVFYHVLFYEYLHDNEYFSLDVIQRLSRFFVKLVKNELLQGKIGCERIDLERNQIMNLMDNLVRLNEWDLVDELTGLMHDYLRTQGYALEWNQVCEWGRSAAQKLSDPVKEGHWLYRLGLVYASQKNYQNSIESFLASLKIAQKNKDWVSLIDNLTDLGELYLLNKDIQNSIEALELSLDYSNKYRQLQRIGEVYRKLGLAYHTKGDIRVGALFFCCALRIAKRKKDAAGQVEQLINLGDAYLSMGEFAKAFIKLNAALVIARKYNNPKLLISCHLKLANFFVNAGYFERSDKKGQSGKAIDYYTSGLSDARDIKDRQAEGKILQYLGLYYFLRKRHDKALVFLKKALDISWEVNDKHCERDALSNLGLTYYELGQYDEATSYMEKAIEVTKVIGDRQNEEKINKNLAIAKQLIEKPDKPDEIWQQCLIAISMRVGRDKAERIFLIAQIDDTFYNGALIERAKLVLRSSIDLYGNEIEDIVYRAFQEFEILSVDKNNITG